MQSLELLSDATLTNFQAHPFILAQNEILSSCFLTIGLWFIYVIVKNIATVSYNNAVAGFEVYFGTWEVEAH